MPKENFKSFKKLNYTQNWTLISYSSTCSIGWKGYLKLSTAKSGSLAPKSNCKAVFSLSFFDARVRSQTPSYFPVSTAYLHYETKCFISKYISQNVSSVSTTPSWQFKASPASRLLLAGRISWERSFASWWKRWRSTLGVVLLWRTGMRHWMTYDWAARVPVLVKTGG